MKQISQNGKKIKDVYVLRSVKQVHTKVGKTEGRSIIIAENILA